MGSTAIQPQIVFRQRIFPQRIQIISKLPGRAFDRQREYVRELKQHAQCGMVRRRFENRFFCD